MLPSTWPCYSDEEIEKVSSILRSGKVNYWTGEEGRLFEREFAEYIGTRYAIAIANGSLALDLIIQALGISPGDEVIVSPRTFIASVGCIVSAGAIPVFADVDPDSQNITATTVRASLTAKTKAIICVHLAGWPCDMDEIMDIAKDKGLWVIEDCAQAHGATYKGRAVGSLGHVAAFSFCQDKIISTGGEGGMITTNDENLWDKIWSLKDHGKSYKAVFEQTHSPGFRWVHNSFGTNARMTEMQSAIGRIQLRRLSDWNRQRRSYAQAILSHCAKYSVLRAPQPGEEINHAYYKCYVFVVTEKIRADWNRNRIIQEVSH
ncbi:MAG: DegT/DnrJ/EryC1/StrS aminotransferase family protein, partial [Gammaproteobacteria bacterium]|nr:DegT/DnrJ/EryC1/StrS aminotransferase family protein [Gammaproteobacteria bacterium]